MNSLNDAKRFALIGAAGYIAPKHFNAIKKTQNTLVAALDPFDSVGILDSYFPKVDFFTEFERFDRHIEKEKSQGRAMDYLTICTPNYLHDAHIRFGLRHQLDVICEKPLVLNPWNMEALQKIEKETDRKVNIILQRRLHPGVLDLQKRISQYSDDRRFDVDLTYITSRGKWYYASWKGDISKSGGVATNIGIHFFDLLSLLFGEVQENTVHVNSHDRAAGFLQFERANVRWFLGIDESLLPKNVHESGERTYRVIKINNEELDLNEGDQDLHIESYMQILRGKGFTINDTKAAIQIVHDIRNSTPVGAKGCYHPFIAQPPTKHPFQRF